MNDTAIATITKQCPVKLDPYRKEQLNNQLVDARMEELRITEHMKNVTESLKAKIKEEQKRQNDAARALHAGFEYVPVPCEHRVELESNRMVTFRTDTCETVEERALTADEIKHYSKKNVVLKP